MCGLRPNVETTDHGYGRTWWRPILCFDHGLARPGVMAAERGDDKAWVTTVGGLRPSAVTIDRSVTIERGDDLRL